LALAAWLDLLHEVEMRTAALWTNELFQSLSRIGQPMSIEFKKELMRVAVLMVANAKEPHGVGADRPEHRLFRIRMAVWLGCGQVLYGDFNLLAHL